jgi:hypothetical protein
VEVPGVVPLYRIAYVSDAQAYSVVRELSLRPVPGDELTLDENTTVAVREVVAHQEGDTIAAEVVAETVAGAAGRGAARATGSAFRSSR